MDPTTEYLAKLLFDREARRKFLAGELELPENLREDFAEIDKNEFTRSAEKTVAQLHAILRSTFPAVFEEWARLTPEDSSGRELVLLYMASPAFAFSRNFAWREGDRSLATAFPVFLDTLSLT